MLMRTGWFLWTVKKVSDYDKPLTNLKKDYYSYLTNETPDIETSNKIMKEVNHKNKQEPTQ